MIGNTSSKQTEVYPNTRIAPAPFAAALRNSPAPIGVHSEFQNDGAFDTGSISLKPGVSLRASRDRLRLVVPTLPQTIASALLGRHVSVVIKHGWLADPRLIIEQVNEEDGAISILLAKSDTLVLSE